MLHPLFTLNNSFLFNWNDSSSLLVPVLTWSAGNNIDALIGAQFAVGKGIRETQLLGSEYGIIPSSVFGTIRIYF
jgi:hypothetical protein